MPDMITKASSVVRLSTMSDDFNAIVRGPGVDAAIGDGGLVPTSNVGYFTVSIADRQLRNITASLTDTAAQPLSIPPSVTKTQPELVVIAYKVVP